MWLYVMSLVIKRDAETFSLERATDRLKVRENLCRRRPSTGITPRHVARNRGERGQCQVTLVQSYTQNYLKRV